jgi:broad specificity phosphatase PhoE
MVRLLLVRHGESVWNEEERIQGQQDAPLSELGRKQAKALGRRLCDEPITACYSSPLRRATETAQEILSALTSPPPIITMPELMERRFGEWEGKCLSDLDKVEFARWLAAHQLPAPPDGESMGELLLRVEQGLRRILTEVPKGSVLVVGHGGSLKAMLCVLLRLPPTSFARLRIDNASLTIVEVQSGQASLVVFNDTCHLQAR